MLIPEKLHSRNESRNSRVSIETVDFAVLCRNFTCVIDDGPGNHRLRPSDAAGQSVDVSGGMGT